MKVTKIHEDLKNLALLTYKDSKQSYMGWQELEKTLAKVRSNVSKIFENNIFKDIFNPVLNLYSFSLENLKDIDVSALSKMYKIADTVDAHSLYRFEEGRQNSQKGYVTNPITQFQVTKKIIHNNINIDCINGTDLKNFLMQSGLFPKLK